MRRIFSVIDVFIAKSEDLEYYVIKKATTMDSFHFFINI